MSKILITGARAPVALHLTRLLGAAGETVFVADSVPATLAAASRYAAGFARLPSPNADAQAYGDALAALLAREAIDTVLPTCEEIFHLAALWARRDLPAKLLAPPLPQLLAFHDKFHFHQTLATLGLPTPETRLLTSKAAFDQIRDLSQIVLKPALSRFGGHVHVAPDLRVLARIRPTPETPWLAQDFIPGTDLCSWSWAHDGKVTASVIYRPDYRTGRHGAATCCQPTAAPDAQEMIRQIAAETQWTGHLAFDFRRDPMGKLWFLECNPRATSGLHFFRDPKAFAAALQGEGAAIPTDRPQIMRSAALLYSLPRAVRDGTLRPLLRDLRRAQPMLDWPGDPISPLTPTKVFAQFATRALLSRQSLTDASVADIAWNRPDQS
ncbi:hypothetical protein ACMA5I_12050 [Paracoccaceae bacterium GXU_MW_L88]